MSGTQIQQTAGTSSNNQGYNVGSALEVRLNTKPILEACEVFLSGRKMVVERDEKGNIKVGHLTVGKPKMNEEGVQALLNRLSLIINPSVVQGNFDINMYQREIYQIRRSLAKNMMVNLYAWGINEGEYPEIIDALMTEVKTFLSRLLENKERESYDSTIKVLESNTLQQKGRFQI